MSTAENKTIVAMLNRGLNKKDPTEAELAAQLAQVETQEGLEALAKSLGDKYAALSDADFTNLVMSNLGVTAASIGVEAFTALQPAVVDYVTTIGYTNRGLVALQLGQILATKKDDATFGAVATAWNTEVAASAGLTEPVTFMLTTGADTISGTAGDDLISGLVAATGSTFGNTDVIVDASATDNDVLTVTTNGSVTAKPIVSGIESVIFNVKSFTAPTVAVDNVRGATITVNQTQDGGSGDANVEGVASGNTVKTGSTVTGTVTVQTVDNGVVTIDSAATTINVTQVGGNTDKATITATGGKATTGVAVSAGANVDGTLTVTATATGDLTLTATAAKTVVATNTAGAIDAHTTALTAATSVNLTGKDEVKVKTTAATAVTLSSGGTATTPSIVADTGTKLVTLNLSGNAKAATYDIGTAASVKTVNITGDQNVTVVVDAANVSALTNGKLTVVDSSTGTSTLSIDDFTGANTLDLSAAAVDNIKLAANAGAGATADSITLATGANVEIASDITAVTLTSALLTADTNTLNLAINDDAPLTSVASSYEVTSLTATNFATVNLDLADPDAAAGGVALTTLNIGTGKLVVTGGAAAAITNLTAGSMDASAATGVVTMTLQGAGQVKTVTTGEGEDVLTVADAPSSGAFTIKTGAGNDTIKLDAANAVYSISVDGGAGRDTLGFTTSLDFSAKTVSLTSVDVIDLDRDGNAAAVTVTLGSSAMSGLQAVIKSSTLGGGNAADDVLAIVADGATVDLSGLVVDTSSVQKVTVDTQGYGVFTAISVTGTNGVDEITATTATKALTALTGAGNDVVAGTSAADYIDGGDDNDNLSGAGGADTILGGAGTDTITGGTGADTLTGGAGSDTFVYTTSGDSTKTAFDSITDFTTGASTFDKLDVADTTVTSLASANAISVTSATAETETGTLTAYATNGVIVLAGTDKANVNTLAEWVAVAELLAQNVDVANNATKDQNLAFEFNGDTYVYNSTIVDANGAETFTFNNLIKLVGLTGVTSLDVAANTAAGVVVLA